MAPFRPGTRGTSEGFLRFVCAKNPNNGRLEEEFPHVLRNLFASPFSTHGFPGDEAGAEGLLCRVEADLARMSCVWKKLVHRSGWGGW